MDYLLKPLFSVIIPTYNREERLNICLDSLVNQTYKNFEVIVCDDGSEDNTKEVIELFKDKLSLKYMWEKNWGGPARPRNNGIKIAHGEWICFLDSDDWWYPNKLQECLKYLPYYDFIYHDMHIYTAKGKQKWHVSQGRHLSKVPYEDLILNGNGISNSTVVVRKSILDKTGKISEDYNLIAVEDYDYWIKIATITPNFYYIPKCLAGYWIGSANISFSKDPIENLEYLFYKNLNLLSERLKHEARKRFAYRKGAYLKALKKKDLALICYKSSIKSNKLFIAFKSLIQIIHLKIC